MATKKVAPIKMGTKESPAPPPPTQGLDLPLWLSEAHSHPRNPCHILISNTYKKKEKMTKLGIRAFFHLKSYVALSNVSWSDVLGGLEYFQNFFLVDTLQVESMWAQCFVRICTNPLPCPPCLSALYWFPFHLLLLAPPANLTFYSHSSSLQKEIEPINGILSKTFLKQTYI